MRRSIRRSSTGEQLVRYSRSTLRWIAAGRPERTDEQVTELLVICQACEHWDDGKCGKCGCRLTTSSGWSSKLRRATENCPVGRW